MWQPHAQLEILGEGFLAFLAEAIILPREHQLGNVQQLLSRVIGKIDMVILREAGSGTRKAIEQLFAKYKLEIKMRMELGSNEAIKQAVIGGLGVSVLSRHTLSPDAPVDQIAILNVEGFPIERHWYIAYLSGKQLSVVTKTFVDCLKQAPRHIGDTSLYSPYQAASTPRQMRRKASP